MTTACRVKVKVKVISQANAANLTSIKGSIFSIYSNLLLQDKRLSIEHRPLVISLFALQLWLAICNPSVSNVSKQGEWE